MRDVHDPSLLDVDAFVLGPHLEGDDPCVDPVFAKDLATALADVLADDPRALDALEGEPETVSDVDPSLVFRSTVAGVVLFDGDRPVGGILGVDIVLTPDRRGRGLGAEIVLETYMRDGWFRFWDLDEAGFSPAGLRTMRAAHAMGLDRSVFERKAGRLIAEAGHAPGM